MCTLTSQCSDALLQKQKDTSRMTPHPPYGEVLLWVLVSFCWSLLLPFWSDDQNLQYPHLVRCLPDQWVKTSHEVYQTCDVKKKKKRNKKKKSNASKLVCSWCISGQCTFFWVLSERQHVSERKSGLLMWCLKSWTTITSIRTEWHQPRRKETVNTTLTCIDCRSGWVAAHHQHHARVPPLVPLPKEMWRAPRI